MQVTKVKPSEEESARRGHRFTEEELQNEFNYIQAGNITRKLLERGLITGDEYDRIMKLNRLSFPSFLAPLY